MPKTKTIHLIGDIGGFFGMIDDKQVIAELPNDGSIDVIEVIINSDGGSVFTAVSIYNHLKAHSAVVNVFVRGAAASAASIIAMAGDTITMGEGSFMMIHNAMAPAFGDAAELRDVAERIEKVSSEMAGIYARRSGMDETAVQALLDVETLMTGSEAVDLGFADSTEIDTEDAVAAVVNVPPPVNPRWVAAMHPAALVAAMGDRRPKIKSKEEFAPSGETAPDKGAQHEESEDVKMEYKDITAKSLTDERPDLIQEITAQLEANFVTVTAEALESAIAEERTRIVAIHKCAEKVGVSREEADKHIVAGLSLADAQTALIDVMAATETDEGLSVDPLVTGIEKGQGSSGATKNDAEAIQALALSAEKGIDYRAALTLVLKGRAVLFCGLKRC